MTKISSFKDLYIWKQKSILIPMLFPDLKSARWAAVDLNHEAQLWLEGQPENLDNPLLDPAMCHRFVNDVHRRLNVDYSYGGYLEDRSTLWRGSYLDTDQRYIHLGVDFNVPAGTRVAAPCELVIDRIDNDYPDRYGWGTRIIARTVERDVIMIFAHLDQKLDIHVGDVIVSGVVFAMVGAPPFNGDWFAHLHVQIITIDEYTGLLANNLRDLDGYGRAQDLAALKTAFPNPFDYIDLNA